MKRFIHRQGPIIIKIKLLFGANLANNKLEIIKTNALTVEFKAHYADQNNKKHVHHEESISQKTKGVWYYFDETLLN